MGIRGNNVGSGGESGGGENGGVWGGLIVEGNGSAGSIVLGIVINIASFVF